MHMYVAGPMRGYPDFNAPAFDSVATYLRGIGHTVANPIEFDCWTDDNPLPAINFDLSIIINWADAVVALPGWRASQGAKAEVAVALWAGKKVYEASLPDFNNKHQLYPYYTLQVGA